MEVLRVPPYPLITTWNLPDANYDYIVYVEDLVDHSVEETVITSDANGVLIYQIPLSKVEFDREFLIRFYDAQHEHILLEDILSIIRPYVNPTSLGETASEIKEYKMYEVIARSIIDTYINDGFYNHKSILQAQGNGLDYMPVWRMANRVLKVYENNILIYNGQDIDIFINKLYDNIFDPSVNIGLTLVTPHGFEVGDQVTIVDNIHTQLNGTFKVAEIIDEYSFRIDFKYSNIDYTLSYTDGSVGTVRRIWLYNFSTTLDNSAIQKTMNGYYNRLSASDPINTLPISRGDIMFEYRPDGGVFTQGSDYLFVLDEGFRAIPPDVERAATILINDIKCGKLDYYQRYVTQYDTDQYTIKFDGKMLDGTGNMMVDKMLDKYTRGILKFGVL